MYEGKLNIIQKEMDRVDIDIQGHRKKMDGILNRYNLKSNRRIYKFGVLKCSEKFKVLALPYYISIKIKLNVNSRGAHPWHGNRKWVTLRRWGDVHAGGESRARAGEGWLWNSCVIVFQF